MNDPDNQNCTVQSSCACFCARPAACVVVLFPRIARLPQRRRPQQPLANACALSAHAFETLDPGLKAGMCSGGVRGRHAFMWVVVVSMLIRPAKGECAIGFTPKDGEGCKACETGKFKPEPGDSDCIVCESGETSPPRAVPGSACLPSWLHVHNGHYYINLDESVNWSEYYPLRTSWSKVRLANAPSTGDSNVTVLLQDYTFSSSNGLTSNAQAYTQMPWGIVGDCRWGSAYKSGYSLDLVGTPFQVQGSPSIAWCTSTGPQQCPGPAGPNGHYPTGFVSCGRTSCSGSVGGYCGYGGFGTAGANSATLMVANGSLSTLHLGTCAIGYASDAGNSSSSGATSCTPCTAAVPKGLEGWLG